MTSRVEKDVTTWALGELGYTWGIHGVYMGYTWGIHTLGELGYTWAPCELGLGFGLEFGLEFGSSSAAAAAAVAASAAALYQNDHSGNP